MLRRVADLLPTLWSNWTALLGTALATVSGNVMLIFFVVDTATAVTNPYAMGFAYLLMPPVFVIGLVLIAFGSWRARRLERSPSVISEAVSMVMADRRTRRRLWFVVLGTLANVTIVSVVAYKGITYTNSVDFCGKLCHSAMAPEYLAYKRSPHARVPCAGCHIGEGASWFVQSKLSGMGQVWAIFRGKYSRPIKTPIHNLRPAPETCEKCHWPAKFHGTRLLVRHIYKSDEKNTRETNIVRLNVGGMDRRKGRFVGIHWHVSPGVKISYEALDAKRAKIGKITVEEQGKKTRVYHPPADSKGKRSAGEVVERRVMDCVDCHNRPSHTFDPLPERAVDAALTLGKIDDTLPFIRKRAIALLRDTSIAPAAAAARYGDALRRFYRGRYPRLAKSKARSITKAAGEIAWIYRRNIFPQMKIGWGTYPLHIGHRTTTEGCYRCHDDEHATSQGVTVSQDCDQCHEILAEEEEKPDVPPGLLQLGRM